MRIISWNVNGIRAAYQKGAIEWLLSQSPDVICLQEVKARLEQVPDAVKTLEGYETYWNAAERPGYSGVATYTKRLPSSVTMGMALPEFDNEGRVIRTDFEDFVLFNVYFPNGQRGHERVQYKLSFYESLLGICCDLRQNQKNVIVTGDFNTAHMEIDLANPAENVNTSGFLAEERVWVTRYLDEGFLDIYRVLYPEREQYTWWTYRLGARRRNIGWRIDYFLISESLRDRVKDVIISEEVAGSDHCPITLLID